MAASTAVEPPTPLPVRAPGATLEKWGDLNAALMLVAVPLTVVLALPWVLAAAAAPSFALLIAMHRGRWTPAGGFGLPNAVTTGRLLLLLGALVSEPPTAIAVAVLFASLLLDVVDGLLARRSGLTGPFGAAYDVEVDSLHMSTLAVLLVQQNVGPWVLAASLWRYVYVLAPRVMPPRRELPARGTLGRYIYIVATLSMLAALLAPHSIASALAAAATLALSASFVRSFWQRFASDHAQTHWLPRIVAIAPVLLFALVCGRVLSSFWSSGLWEDGYFALRFAYNTWTHGVVAWNPVDGPLYGMTSQLYQLLVTLLYPITPEHMVTACKVIGALSLLRVYALLARLPVESDAHLARAVLPFMALGLPLVANHVTTGLETLLVLPWLGVWLHRYLAFRDGGSSPTTLAVLLVGTYLLRPDAVLIPGIAMLPLLRTQRARTLRALVIAGAAGLVCLTVFKLYYGTALPLPFYVKALTTTALAPKTAELYFNEKLKNALQFVYFFAPIIAVICAARRAVALTLLAASAVFIAYHALSTVEIMGHWSRFYIPAVPVLVGAAALSWTEFRRRQKPWLMAGLVLLWAGSFVFLKDLDRASKVFIFIEPSLELPFVVAMSLMLLPLPKWEGHRGALAVAVMMVGIYVGYPVSTLTLETDRTVLLRQIAPRKVFKGLAELTHLAPKHVYHTDMGAPGVLFPEAKVTDLDGLLNAELVLDRKTFAEICERDRPDAIFFPNEYYPALRKQIRASPCFADYRSVPNTRLYLRQDLVEAYNAVASKR